MKRFLSWLSARMGRPTNSATVDLEAVKALIPKWRNRARWKFLDAEREKNPMGRRLIEHGAICYLNCARELTEALEGSSPQQQEPPSGGQK